MTPAEIYLEMVALIRKGQTINAIKLARVHLPIGLIEAKRLVEAIISTISFRKES